MSRTYATAYTNPCLIALLAGSGDWVAVSEPGMALAPWDQTLPVAPSGVTVTNSRPVGGGGGVPRFKAFSSHPRLWIFPAVFFFFWPKDDTHRVADWGGGSRENGEVRTGWGRGRCSGDGETVLEVQRLRPDTWAIASGSGMVRVSEGGRPSLSPSKLRGTGVLIVGHLLPGLG